MSDSTTDEEAVILRTLGELVEPLLAVMPGNCEVVLHDLRKIPSSIVAIAGDVTGRKVGDPATDRLLRHAATGDYETALCYSSRTPDGAALSCSTLIIRSSTGQPVAALCVNSETGPWETIAALSRKMLPESGSAAADEKFPHDVDELASGMLTQAIADSGVPVHLMKKRHKVAVVRDLRDRGFFTLRESVETAARALAVSRFTVYNYLNESGVGGLEQGS